MPLLRSPSHRFVSRADLERHQSWTSAVVGFKLSPRPPRSAPLPAEDVVVRRGIREKLLRTIA